MNGQHWHHRLIALVINLSFFVLHVYYFLIQSAFAQEDAADCKDSPLFNRMPNYWIPECSQNYNQVEIPVGDNKTETKEGNKTYISYDFNDDSGANPPSFFQIIKNYENAVLKKGGKKIYSSVENRQATFLIKSGGKNIWVMLYDLYDNNYTLTILEIEGMNQDISAGEMLNALNESGSIALYINFESGKSDIKPESQELINQVVQMLKDNPSLKISIEGHTDNAGSAQSNQTLSENRAKAVMNAMIAKDIAQSRLISKGWGQEKPVSDNNTEEGKAKNRRVEIVKL